MTRHIVQRAIAETSVNVLNECRQAQAENREVQDWAARCIASYFQSPGRVGHILAALASGMPVNDEELYDDISATISECYGQDPETDLMLDMLGTWCVNLDRRHRDWIVVPLRRP